MKKIANGIIFLLSIIVILLFLYVSKQNISYSVLETEVNSLKSSKKELNLQIEELKNAQTDSNQNTDNNDRDMESDAPVNQQYMKPEFLNVDWDQVILETFHEKVVIDDMRIMEEFRRQFRGIVVTENPYPGGYRTGHQSFTFHIISGEKRYTFNSLEHDFFKTPDETFYRSEEDYTQLAKAFLSKPTGYPEENILGKLYHSGMIVGEKEFTNPMMDSFRIKGIASILIGMEKEEVNPPSDPGKYQEKFTFYYFGEKFDLILYDEYIHLSDEASTINQWYKAENEQISGILMSLRAG